MSLTVFRSFEEASKLNDMRIVRRNDSFFDTFVSIKDTPLTRGILKDLEKAVYNTDKTFIGRITDAGALSTTLLSSGTKTLMNIISRPDICFSVEECGYNALKFLPRLTSGYVVWEYPLFSYSGEAECDLIYNGRHFTNFYDFLDVVAEEVK